MRVSISSADEVERTHVGVLLHLTITQSNGSVFEAVEGYCMIIPEEW
ncbi:MAG: hypothetical protein OTJ97_08215 [SAR202 cluster bacterium]|nr:hypothetical protein [SAR202 cluster bacterium]